MRTVLTAFKVTAALVLTLGVFAGCESTDGGGSSNTSGSFYYGVGFYDPWYYGGHWDDPDYIVTPPGDRPPGGVGARPEHPIAKPPPVTPTPRPTPTPSIPSAPRPMARPAMRR
jgi:hypothetical protein